MKMASGHVLLFVFTFFFHASSLHLGDYRRPKLRTLGEIKNEQLSHLDPKNQKPDFSGESQITRETKMQSLPLVSGTYIKCVFNTGSKNQPDYDCKYSPDVKVNWINADGRLIGTMSTSFACANKRSVRCKMQSPQNEADSRTGEQLIRDKRRTLYRDDVEVEEASTEVEEASAEAEEIPAEAEEVPAEAEEVPAEAEEVPAEAEENPAEAEENPAETEEAPTETEETSAEAEETSAEAEEAPAEAEGATAEAEEAPAEEEESPAEEEESPAEAEESQAEADDGVLEVPQQIDAEENVIPEAEPNVTEEEDIDEEPEVFTDPEEDTLDVDDNGPPLNIAEENENEDKGLEKDQFMGSLESGKEEEDDTADPAEENEAQENDIREGMMEETDTTDPEVPVEEDGPEQEEEVEEVKEEGTVENDTENDKEAQEETIKKGDNDDKMDAEMDVVEGNDVKDVMDKNCNKSDGSKCDIDIDYDSVFVPIQQEIEAIVSESEMPSFRDFILEILYEAGDYLISLLIHNLQERLYQGQIAEKFQRKVDMMSQTYGNDTDKAMKIMEKKIHEELGKYYQLKIVEFLKQLYDSWKQ